MRYDSSVLFHLKLYMLWIKGSDQSANFQTFDFQTFDFILESKMAELNQNKNLKQLDRLDTLRKLYFTLEINE